MIYSPRMHSSDLWGPWLPAAARDVVYSWTAIPGGSLGPWMHGAARTQSCQLVRSWGLLTPWLHEVARDMI